MASSSSFCSVVNPARLICGGRDADGGRCSIPKTRSSICLSFCRRRGFSIYAGGAGESGGSKVKVWPWLMLPPSLCGSDMYYNFYCLARDELLETSTNKEKLKGACPEYDAEFVGSSHGWLVSYSILKGELFLSNPLTHRHIKLPSPHNMPRDITTSSSSSISVHNVVVSSSPDPDINDDDCRAAMIFGPQNRLAFCCPNRSPDWSAVSLHCGTANRGARLYSSVAYSKLQKLFFCVTDLGNVEAWDVTRLDSPTVVPIPKAVVDSETYPSSCLSEDERRAKCMFRCTKFLAVAEDTDDLFQVRRFTVTRMGPNGSHVKDFRTCDGLYDISLPYKTVDFDVYKYDKEAREWTYMDMDSGLDGMAIFIGMNHGFVLSAADYPQLKPDSIYFTDINEFSPSIPDIYTYGGHDLGIFNYRDKTLSPCYYPCDYNSITRIVPPPIWFTHLTNN